MDDLEKYAPWLEDQCSAVAEHQPVKIGVVLVREDEVALTAYYGVSSNTDKAMLGYHMHADAVMDAVFANARGIVETAEEQEDDLGDEENG